MSDPQKIWQAVLGELELMLSKANFTTWFKNTFIIEVDEKTGEVTIGVPNAFTKSWMEQKYNTPIVKAINNVCKNKIKTVMYQIKSLKQMNEKSVSSITPPIRRKDEAAGEESLPPQSESRDAFGLRPEYTFKSFIVGVGNQLAHSAGFAVAEDPGRRYNPLFLYGEVGLGKTHLMHAIGQQIKERYSKSKILYINFEKFTNDYVAAARKGSFDEFRNYYRGVDVLLVDDVQFMIDKEKTQDEFFHTFEALHGLGKQIVITSDRPPKALVELEDRMISRFEWGMIADIKMPDLETRIAILENKCKERNFDLEQEIIEYLAENIKKSIRELEGALNKIIAWYDLNRKPPTLASARDLLLTIMADPSKTALSPERILDAVSTFYQIPTKDILGACRKRQMVVPRQIVMYLMRQELDHSYPTIGQNMGGRDHTTVMYACQKVEGMLEEEERLQQEMESIRQRLHG